MKKCAYVDDTNMTVREVSSFLHQWQQTLCPDEGRNVAASYGEHNI